MPKPAGPLLQNNPILRQLALAIDASGLNQDEVGRRAGVSQTFISELRTGRKGQTFTLVEAVANSIGLEFKLERKRNGTE